MQDLSGSLSAVLPTAAAAHVGLEQVLGAMGTMTGEGISAQQSAQDLAGTIRSLTNPSQVASKAMAQIGLNSTTVAQQVGKKGLTGTLQELYMHIMQHMGPAGLVLESSFNQSKLAAQSADEELQHLPKSLQGLAKEYLNGQITQKQWTAALKTQPALTAALGKQFSTTAKEAHGFSDSLKSGQGPAKTFNAVLSDTTGGATGLSTALPDRRQYAGVHLECKQHLEGDRRGRRARQRLGSHAEGFQDAARPGGRRARSHGHENRDGPDPLGSKGNLDRRLVD